MIIISVTLAFSTILIPINVELIRGICFMGVQIVKMMEQEGLEVVRKHITEKIPL